jgi:hypothetical protein
MDMTKKIVIGIDPGSSGGMCEISLSGKDISGINLYKVIDINQSFEGTRSVRRHCFMESIIKFPGDYPSKIIEYGKNYGFWEGYLAANGIKIAYVLPLKWQAWISAGSVGRARSERKRIYQKIAQDFYAKYSLGKITLQFADAVCIAKYGMDLILKEDRNETQNEI